MSDLEVGEQTRAPEDFDHDASTTEGFLHNNDLNPNRLTWKQKLARTAAGLGLLGASVVGKAGYDKLSAPPEYFGEAYGDGVPLVTDLVQVEDNKHQLQEPIFHSNPTEGGGKLTEKELLERGYNPGSKEGVIIQEVKGGTYAGNSLYGKGRIEEDGETYGVWGEILVPQLGGEIGQYKRTGIYVSSNYIDQENADKIKMEDGAQPVVLARSDQ